MSLAACKYYGRPVWVTGNFAGCSNDRGSEPRICAEILCDDRIIIRSTTEGFKIYGTWSRGDVPEVSANSAPLKATMFLEKAQENQLIPLEDKKEISKRILACLIRPFVTIDWWEKTLSLVDKLVQEVPCYVLRFDKSGGVVDLLNFDLTDVNINAIFIDKMSLKID